jgi:hypothetical protein
MATQCLRDDIGQFLLACVYPLVGLAWPLMGFVSDRCLTKLWLFPARSYAPTCWVVDERAIDVQLDLAFLSMFWQFFPVYTGDVRARLDAQHQRPYRWSVSTGIGGKYQHLSAC